MSNSSMLGTVNVPYDGYCAAMRGSQLPSFLQGQGILIQTEF
jgi:hypothetical protein